MTHSYRHKSHQRTRKNDEIPCSRKHETGPSPNKATGSGRQQPGTRTPDHAREPLPGGFDGQERNDAEMIWELSAATPFSSGRQPDTRQTDDALKSVHHRLAFPDATGEAAATTASTPAFYRLSVWVAAAAIMLLAFGIGYLIYPKSVSAPYGQQVVTALPDGSTAELNSGTTIRYNRLFGVRNRQLRLDGEVFFTVTPGDKPFVVSANRAVVEVTGTEFNVRSRSDDPGFETRVHVVRGSVALYPSGHSDRSVHLHAGDRSRWNITMETPLEPESAGEDQAGEWRENRFHFRNETLGMIFREIERRFDIRIQLENTRIASEILTAHYSDPGDPERIIEDICHVKGLRFAPTANGFRIYQ